MTDGELERRLIHARPAIPEPPPSARDRAREAALAALPRRRLGRGWVLAVAAVIVTGALIVPSALGVGGDLLDLLPLGGGNETEKKDEERFRGACAATTIAVTFDPVRGAAVTAGGETLAFAGFGRHEVSATCTPLPAKKFASSYPASAFEGLPDKGVYEATTLVCTVPGRVELEAHPIWDEDLGKVGGSNLLVLQGDPPKALVSAVLKAPEPTASPGTSRIYFLPESCTRS